MYAHVLNGGKSNKGNGDHAETLSSVCICEGQAIEDNQNALGQFVDMAEIFKIVREHVSIITGKVSEMDETEASLYFQRPLSPTDQPYYLARVFGLIASMCYHNAKISKDAASFFPNAMLRTAMENKLLHPYVR
eukprot:SAG31_NODE_4390_length_3277_cov_1.888609_2_plen_134_part_00